MAASINQATCIKQACIHFPKRSNTLKCTCIKQEHFEYPLGACLRRVGLYLASAETVRDHLLPVETSVHDEWLPAESVR